MKIDIGCLLQSNGINLGPAQRRRLDWLVARYGVPVMRSGTLPENGVIIVADAPSGAGAELFCRAMQPAQVVAIPFGENPAFDFLKSKLTGFGTCGPCGADGPHELWWGGLEWPAPEPSDTSLASLPRIISCYPRGRDETSALRLRGSLEKFQLNFDIQPIATSVDGQISCAEKTNFLLQMSRRYREPLLFIEANAELRRPPLLPAWLQCDVAVHKWNGWEMSARIVYLGTSDAAAALLRTWHQLACVYPSIWEGHLLDQAWSLTSSQMSLDTGWLPRSYHALRGEFAARHAAVIHDLPVTTADLGPNPDFADDLRAARRAGRTGARDSFIVLRSANNSNKSLSVILREVGSHDARAVSASIEALTSAFVRDCGGFDQFELSLCASHQDTRTARDAAKRAQNHLIEIAVGQLIPHDIFCSHAQDQPDDRAAIMKQQQADQYYLV